MENGKRWLLLAAGTAVYALGIDLGCHAGFGGTKRNVPTLFVMEGEM